MGVTADGIPFPELTDSPNGPAQVLALASWVDGFLVTSGNSAWTDWTPTMSQGAGVTVTNTRSKWMQIGKLVIARATIVATSSGTLNNACVISVPTPMAATEAAGGIAQFFDASAQTSFICFTHPSDTTHMVLIGHASTVTNGGLTVAVANSDTFRALMVYEAA